MFLDVLRRRNPDFIRAAQSLHQAGMIGVECRRVQDRTLSA